MQTYQQFKAASARSDAIIGETLAGPVITDGMAPLGLISSVAIPPVRRHRKKVVDSIGFPKEISQQAGAAISLGLPIGLAPAIGQTLFPNSPDSAFQSALGIIGAAVAAHIGGGILAAFTPTWDKKKMDKYKNSGLATAADWLVPGAGVYHRMKTIGYLLNKPDKKKA